jgi:hypothetical protein
MNKRVATNCELDRNVEGNGCRIFQAALRHMTNEESQYPRRFTDEAQHSTERGVTFIKWPHTHSRAERSPTEGRLGPKPFTCCTLPMNRPQE